MSRPLGKPSYWFQGRISRSEFWRYFILWFTLYSIIGVVSEKLGVGGAIIAVFLMFSIGANYAITVRRCHDFERSGWYALLWFIPVVQIWLLLQLAFRRGTIGENEFEPEPPGVCFQWLRAAHKSGVTGT